MLIPNLVVIRMKLKFYDFIVRPSHVNFPQNS